MILLKIIASKYARLKAIGFDECTKGLKYLPFIFLMLLVATFWIVLVLEHNLVFRFLIWVRRPHQDRCNQLRYLNHHQHHQHNLKIEIDLRMSSTLQYLQWTKSWNELIFSMAKVNKDSKGDFREIWSKINYDWQG